MKRMKGKAFQSKPAQASGRRERRCHFRDTQDQFFGFPTERLVAEKGLPGLTKRQSTEPARRSNIGSPNRTLRNRSMGSRDDQYLTHLDHVNSEKVSTKKIPALSKIAEDDLQCAPVTCKRTWLRQVKLPTSTTVNRKNRCSPSGKGGAIIGMHSSSVSPRRTEMIRKENHALEGDRSQFKFVSQRFSKSDSSRNRLGLQVRDEKHLSPECFKLQSLLENQIKSVPSQSWSVNADAIPSLKRSSTTIFSHKTYFKPPDEFSFLNREAGDLSTWVVEGLDTLKVSGQPNPKAGDQTKKYPETNHPLTDSSKSKNSNVVIHQNIKKKILTHRKVSSAMSKPRPKPKQNRDQARFNNSTESQSLSIKRRSRLNHQKPKAESEETDLSMIPMKDSDSKESLLSSYSNCSDKVVNMLSQCSTADSWDPYNVHAEEGMTKCINKPCSAYLMNFDPSLDHCGAVGGQNITKPQMKTTDLEPFMRIRLKSSKVEDVPVKQTLTSKENLNSLTDSVDWSKFTPVCHIYDGSAPSKLSSPNVGSGCDDSIKVINIDDPTFFKASDTAVISELKDTTSTWMTGHLGTHSQMSFTSSMVEEHTLESKKDDMPAGFRVNANRITLHVESMGMRLQHSNTICLHSNGEKSRPIVKNAPASVDRGQIAHSSSSEGVSETIREGPKIMYSLNKQEDKINSSLVKKHNWQQSERTSMTEKNIENVVPPKSQQTQLSAANAQDNLIKRTSFQRRKQNRRNIFGKTITNRHKGFKDQSKCLRTYVLPKQEKFGARFSPIRKTRKSNHGAIPTEPTKSTFNRGAETPADTNELKKDIDQQRYKFTPSRVPTEPVAGDQLALFSSAEIKRKMHEFQRSVSSYPPATNENQKMMSDDLLEIPVMEQSIQKAETMVLTVTNVQTSTTNFSERCTPSEVANRRYGRRFRIRVFVKPPKKRAASRLAQEANMAMPVAFGEDAKAHGVVKCETTRSPKSVAELSIKSCEVESTSTQFQSMQDFMSASYSKNDLTGFVCKSKHTRDHVSGAGVEQLSKSPRVTTVSSDAAQVTKESMTVWDDVVSPSPKARKAKPPPHAQVPCIPRYPKRFVRRQQVQSSWDQIQSEITPIIRPLILIMFCLCVVYLTIMTAFSLLTIQRY